MNLSEVEQLQQNILEDPTYVDYLNIGIGFIKNDYCMKNLLIWRIVSNDLIPIENNTLNVFYDYESYLIQCTFECCISNTKKDQTIFFNWRGMNASKGLSPLPESFDNDDTIVERVVQWSEPPAFFHVFTTPIITLNCKFGEFNYDLPHLFMVRGEIRSEIHLYELPYVKSNLRSRGIFVIIVPDKKTIFVWKGAKINEELNALVKEINVIDLIKSSVNDWNKFDSQEINEGDEHEVFPGDESVYLKIYKDCNYTPRLFYLNSITGQFAGTEVAYPLRKRGCIAAFPFLKSHLDSGDELGYFLLDNFDELWLVSNNPEKYPDSYKLATETAQNYKALKEKQINKTVALKYTNPQTRQIEFTNLFPYWK